MKKYIPVIIAVLVLVGCRTGKQVAPSFYLIEYSAAQMNPSDTITPLPFTLEIMDVDVHPAFATNQIALREETHELSYFVNHQWATRPQNSLERFTVNYFNQNKIFQHTERRFWNVQPDFKLFITVYNIEVIKNENDFFAHMHADFRLESVNGEIIQSHTLDEMRLLEKRNLNMFTRAINNIFYEELNFFCRKVHFALSPAEGAK